MPRPKNGYTNAAGQKVPGATDITGRYKEMGALMHWAHSQGSKGLPLYARAAIDIGTTVHHMAELDLKGRPDREIEAYTHECLTAPEHLRAAWNAFNAFRTWRQQCHVRAIAQEVSIVSEQYQYGGTPDCIAIIDGKVALLDFKTSPKPYAEHLIAMAAHAHLWNERHPDQRIEAFHLICLPKDGSEFQHHAYADLSLQWQIFGCWLDAWRLEKGLTRKRTTKPTTVMPAPKAALTMQTVDPFRPASAPPLPPPPAAIPRPPRARKPKAAVEVTASDAKPKRARKTKAAPTSVPVVPAIVVTEQRSAAPWARGFFVMSIAAGTAVITWMRGGA